jgi:hypothetical protein
VVPGPGRQRDRVLVHGVPKVAAWPRCAGSGAVDDEGLARIWPAHHENVHFYGTHWAGIDAGLAQPGTDGYRPARIPDTDIT